MDKRSLLFALLLTVTLFFVHNFFSTKEQPKVPNTEIVKEKEAESQERELAMKRVAPVSSLPIVSLYSDENASQVVTLAAQTGGQYLTFSWTTSLPKTLYVKRNKKVEKVELRIDSSKLKTPILYSAVQEQISTISLPPNETFDLQLVTFSGENQKANVTIGEVLNQQVYTPIKKLESPAIALYKNNDEYLVYGIYDPSFFRLRTLTDYPYFSSIVKTQEVKISPPAKEGEERFYVLENGYQQLVFSNVGGALAEINLPLKSPDHPDSVIRPIEFDKIMKEKYPQSDYFPNNTYYTADTKGGGKPVFVESRKLGGYYPLIRRSVIGAGGRVVLRTPPRYYALNLVSSDQKTSELVYTVKNLGTDFIEFEASQPDRRIIKRFSFPKDPKTSPYCIDLSIRVEGNAQDLSLTSGVPEVELMSGSFSPALKYRIISHNKASIEQVDLPKTSNTISSIHPDWVCNSNGFLGLIVDPLTDIGAGITVEKIPGEFDPTRLTVIDAQEMLYPANKYPGYEIKLPLANTSQTQDFRVFAGPFASGILKTIDKTYVDPSQGYSPSYISSQSFHGWFAFISEPFAKFLFFLMKGFYQISRSWGISIILLTIALRIMLYPLNAWSIKSTTKMQEIAPLVSSIQERHKKDPKRAQQEIVALYREKGVNPFSGCLPILIQLPFLIGMFDLLKSTFELRGASFIPHWIDNLTAPDVLFSWNYNIIFIGSDFHLLPILIGVVMYYQQKFSSTMPKDKAALTDQQKQQKFMGNLMVIVFTVMFYNFPSGLNIYWLFSILLGILQQWYMTKRVALKKA
jgi:YidC/Oxa1 family membrane protein insertase